MLEKIFIDKLSAYMLSQIEGTLRSESFRCKHCGTENSMKVNELIQKNSTRVFDAVADYVHIPFSMRFITKEVRNTLKSLIRVMDFPREHVKQKIELEQQILDSCDPNNENVKSRKRLISYCAELR